VYAALADAPVDRCRVVGVRGTCWRHEGARLRPLARGWAFTMRETVCVGSEAEALAFRDRGARRTLALASTLGLPARLAEATDPFFAPTARGRALLQRVKGLKQELLLGVGPEELAASSFNLHERFFGEAYGIALPCGSAASTACVAHGVERWLLAVLAAHGCDPRGWPPIPSMHQQEVPA
jgi:seryl-tRNA synthetase